MSSLSWYWTFLLWVVLGFLLFYTGEVRVIGLVELLKRVLLLGAFLLLVKVGTSPYQGTEKYL